MITRDSTIRLTRADKRAAKKAFLDSSQGVIRRNGSLWIIFAVVRSHYQDEANFSREQVYVASNAVAEWLGFDSWMDIAIMQRPENVERFRKIIRSAR